MSKVITCISYFTLFGLAMGFFGNLYEAVVIGPNMINDSLEQLQHFQKFFSVINPVYYYVPISQLSIVTLFIHYFIARKNDRRLKKLLGFSALAELISLILTVYIVTQINFTLFFGDLDEHTGEIAALALRWNVLNAIRVGITAIGLVMYFKAFLYYYACNNRKI